MRYQVTSADAPGDDEAGTAASTSTTAAPPADASTRRFIEPKLQRPSWGGQRPVERSRPRAGAIRSGCSEDETNSPPTRGAGASPPPRRQEEGRGMVEEGKPAPDFELAADDASRVR